MTRFECADSEGDLQHRPFSGCEKHIFVVFIYVCGTVYT